MGERRATSIDLFGLATTPMRVFHLTWMAFLVCFFAWFAVAPLMPLIRADLGLSKDQIANINIAAVLVTVLARLAIGPMCDRYGARRTYTWLLAFGAIPVFGIAFAQTYEAFLFFRLLIGAIGASFVITQYHTSLMFAPNVVGTANATVAGWGNAGGGVAQAVMPLIVAALVSFGVEQQVGWRAALFVPGAMMLVMAALYWRFALDTPEGNLRPRAFAQSSGVGRAPGLFRAAARNYRVWLLFVAYAACFGVELTIHGIAAIYYVDRFGLDLETAGIYAGSFGLLAVFARPLGGFFSDRVALRRGLDGRTVLLSAVLLAEAAGLVLFAQMNTATSASLAMLAFGLFTHVACGATFSLVPFIDRKTLGGVAGIVGAGGNVGAVLAGFLMKGGDTTQAGILAMGCVVAVCAVATLSIRFSPEHKESERRLLEEALAARAIDNGGSGVEVATS